MYPCIGFCWQCGTEGGARHTLVSYDASRVVKESTDIPPGVFNVLTAEDPVSLGEQLVKDPRVDMISFTGSTIVGKRNGASLRICKKVFLGSWENLPI